MLKLACDSVLRKEIRLHFKVSPWKIFINHKKQEVFLQEIPGKKKKKKKNVIEKVMSKRY